MAPRKDTLPTTRTHIAVIRKPGSTKDTRRPKTSFLDLPAEIRNTVYDLSLAQQTIMFPKPSKLNKKGRAKCPGILMVCQQICQESVNMFYAKMAFRFECQDKMLTWLRKIGTKKRVLLQEVIVDKIASLPYLPHYMAALTTNDRRMRDHARETLLVLERRLRDCGTPLPVKVYKIRVRHELGSRVTMFHRWESQEWMFGEWVTVTHIGQTEMDREGLH